MHVFMKPKEAADLLGFNEQTIRKWIERGDIKEENVITNGLRIGEKGVRYAIDMTKQFGIEPEPARSPVR